LGSYRFVVGLEPDLAVLERETSVAILDLFGNGATWALLRVAANRIDSVKACFGGIAHVYETEEEARRVWQIFGRSV
jgi:hypothetical protein